MDAQLRVFEFKTKDGDNDITRYTVQQMTDRDFRTLTIKVGTEFKNTVFDKKTDATNFMKLIKKL
jgi:hypothetical protein